MAENENKANDNEQLTGGFYRMGETLAIFSLISFLIGLLIGVAMWWLC